jgi:hypothetical protein
MIDHKLYRLDVRGLPAGDWTTLEGLRHYANPGFWTPERRARWKRIYVNPDDLQRASREKLRELAEERDYEALKAGVR